MTIEFRCECGELFQVEDEFAGRKGRCPTCKRIMIVPEKEPEPLELQEEIREEPELSDFQAPAATPDPSPEPPAGQRVEEEVEVLKGWDGPEPDLDRSDRVIQPRASRPWRGLSRPLLFGVPAVFMVILLVFLLLKPSRQRTEHPTKEQALSPQGLQSSMPSPPPSPQPEPPTEPPVAAPKVEVSEAQSPPLPAGLQAEKQAPGQAPPPTQSRVQEKPTGAPSSHPAAVRPKESTPTARTSPKEPASKPQASVSPRAPSPTAQNYTVNVGAFKSQGMAEAYAEVLRKRGLDPFVWSTESTKGQGRMYRVSVGRFSTKRQADLYAKELKDKQGLTTYVVKKPGS
ncbi:MAG: SPOR domain-containing protein [Thermodesulfobacteriota bacterium]